MNKSLIVLTTALALAAFNAAAHGDVKPVHGGIVTLAADLHFELVPQPNGALLYVLDHGEPADASTMSGKLTVLNGSGKSEAALQAAGANRLEALNVTLAAGSKVIATVRGAGGKVTTVRFAVR